jgi:hypothetical protein
MSVQKGHIHNVLSIPTKVSVSEMMGVLKGELAIKLFRGYSKMKQKPYRGNIFYSQRILSRHGWNRQRSNKEVCEIPRRRKSRWKMQHIGLIFKAPFSEGGFFSPAHLFFCGEFCKIPISLDRYLIRGKLGVRFQKD